MVKPQSGRITMQSADCGLTVLINGLTMILTVVWSIPLSWTQTRLCPLSDQSQHRVKLQFDHSRAGHKTSPSRPRRDQDMAAARPRRDEAFFVFAETRRDETLGLQDETRHFQDETRHWVFKTRHCVFKIRLEKTLGCQDMSKYWLKMRRDSVSPKRDISSSIRNHTFCQDEMRHWLYQAM